MTLKNYRAKRDFKLTPEPAGAERGRDKTSLRFVVQKHAARRLHYDFRLELDGVLMSWAVPKGPTCVPGVRRLAVHTEDHPLEYGDFEGDIPAGQYGAGSVELWDRGEWIPKGDPSQGLADGKIEFTLLGQKLRGLWTLVQMAPKAGDNDNWLLLKKRDRDAHAPEDPEIVLARPESVGDATSVAATRLREVQGATRARFPTVLKPQLPTLAERVPAEGSWFHEPKLDGYRVLCKLESGKARLFTRAGKDWTHRFSGIVAAAEKLSCVSAILDGEAVVFDRHGRSDFQALQNAIGKRGAPIVMVAFDLLYLDGWDLRAAVLRDRKQVLLALLNGAPPSIRYGDHVEGHGSDFFREACRAGLEGIVAKRADARYLGKRTRSWLKLKCSKREELVIVGFTEPKGMRNGLGALLLATRDAPGETLRYAGKVGTGFDEACLQSLRKLLDERIVSEPACTGAPSTGEMSRRHWVEPDLVASLRFAGWTMSGMVRQASFQGLREDKPAGEVIREGVGLERDDAGNSSAIPKNKTQSRIAGIKLSNPGKCLFESPPVTKLDLARYYEEISEFALVHLRNRPLTLLRCPNGYMGECFYQRHLRKGSASAIAAVIAEKGEPPLPVVKDLSSVIALVQLGAIELHVWGAHCDHLEEPDTLVFDLDPDLDLPWSRVVQDAFFVRDRLRQLGLLPFVRLTGGKGLHIVVPIISGPSWVQAKAFTRAFAESIVREEPARYTAKMSKQRRRGKIYIDYLRNGRQATAIASYSPRARTGAPVALPIEWNQLNADAEVAPMYSVLEVPMMIRRRDRDPWQDFEASRRPMPIGE